jgi:hypothetical protein
MFAKNDVLAGYAGVKIGMMCLASRGFTRGSQTCNAVTTPSGGSFCTGSSETGVGHSLQGKEEK